MTIIDGFVIKSIDFGDYDKIITFFSDKYGKLNIFAPGVRKPTSKNKYSVELFVKSTLEIFKSKRNKLSKLKTGTLIKEHNDIAKNYFNYILASVVGDVTDMIFAENEKSFSYFQLLDFILNSINDNSYPFKNLVIYLFKALKYTNANWNLERSIISKEKIIQPTYFDIKNFGLITKSEYTRLIDKSDIMENADLLISLKKIRSSTVEELKDIDLKIEDALIILKLLLNYYEFTLGIWSNSFKELSNTPFIKN